MKLTAEQVREVFPKCSIELARELCKAMESARIDTAARIAAFLAQIGHESAGLTALSENLNYSAQSLATTWPQRFRAPNGQPNATALSIARKPVDIANTVYAGRMGNGPASTGDGWRYRGRGPVQLTGRANYAAASAATGLPLEESPDLAALPEGGAKVAAWFWSKNGLNALADADRFEEITKRINGGLIGYRERLELRNRIVSLMAGWQK